MHVLLHICCGPCAAFPLKQLRESGYAITGYFYNPNIHPYKEFSRRLETAKEFASKMGLKMIADSRYLLDDFLQSVLNANNGRCSVCYEMRLREAARFAKTNHFDCFSTSLLVSPHQKHELIREIGEKVAEEEGIPFCYIDFRTGWTEGIAISKALELYRQPYCGCIFSEMDRYYKPPKEVL
ncbi:epoxyqueuosine reductase QueH [bacterium BFN5]|nr:epoxyqueuosine reductase QueH [bacterium BFN5]QJW47118.1 epoxyqueuosine reductase QueH [bacterium BFN5]